MKFFKYILVLLALNFYGQPSKIYKKLPVKNNCLAQPVGTLVYNDFNSASWTYTGTGSATFTTGTGITLTGGVSSVASNLLYTAMPTNLNTSTTTVRVTMTGVDASNGVVGLGVVSNNSATLRHFVIINCRTGASKGNMLMFYDNAFDSETQPTVIPKYFYKN